MGSYKSQLIEDTIEVMLKRPEMYAQNPASLEDQFHLLMVLVAELSPGMDLGSFKEDYRAFRQKVMKKFPPNCTLATEFETFTSLKEKLQEFYIAWKVKYNV